MIKENQRKNRIKDLPEDQRPREKLLKYGAEKLKVEIERLKKELKKKKKYGLV